MQGVLKSNLVVENYDLDHLSFPQASTPQTPHHRVQYT